MALFKLEIRVRPNCSVRLKTPCIHWLFSSWDSHVRVALSVHQGATYTNWKLLQSGTAQCLQATHQANRRTDKKSCSLSYLACLDSASLIFDACHWWLCDKCAKYPKILRWAQGWRTLYTNQSCIFTKNLWTLDSVQQETAFLERSLDLLDRSWLLDEGQGGQGTSAKPKTNTTHKVAHWCPPNLSSEIPKLSCDSCQSQCWKMLKAHLFHWSYMLYEYIYMNIYDMCDSDDMFRPATNVFGGVAQHLLWISSQHPPIKKQTPGEAWTHWV